MFDVGFSELLLIALIALIVLGPKRLPEAARAAGRWVGRLRRFISEVKRDFDQELRGEELDELRRLKHGLEDTRRMIGDSSNRILQGLTGETSTGPTGPTAAPIAAAGRARRASGKKHARAKKSRGR